MELKSLQLDLNGSNEGIFFPFGEDCEIKIAQWNNKSHKKFLREIHAKHGRKIQAGAITDSQADALMVGQWPHIIKDWNGITEDGENLPYSAESVIALAINPQYKAFFEKIEGLSKEEENFRIENVKEMGEALPTI